MYGGVGTYLQSVRQFDLISKEKSYELSKVIMESEDPDAVKKAKEELVVANLFLVVNIATTIHKNQFHEFNRVGIQLIDLISSGNIGLFNAACLFDYRFGFSFSPYAYPSIKHCIYSYIREMEFIKKPVSHGRIRSTINKLTEDHGNDLNDEIIIENIAGSAKALNQYRAASKNSVTSLSASSYYHDDGSKVEVGDSIKDTSIPAPFYDMSKEDLRGFLKDCMHVLKPREKYILEETFLNPEENSSAFLVKDLQISRQRVNQLLQSALCKVRIQLMKKWNDLPRQKAFAEIDFVIAFEEFGPISLNYHSKLGGYDHEEVYAFNQASHSVFVELSGEKCER